MNNQTVRDIADRLLAALDADERATANDPAAQHRAAGEVLTLSGELTRAVEQRDGKPLGLRLSREAVTVLRDQAVLAGNGGQPTDEQLAAEGRRIGEQFSKQHAVTGADDTPDARAGRELGAAWSKKQLAERGIKAD